MSGHDFVAEVFPVIEVSVLLWFQGYSSEFLAAKVSFAHFNYFWSVDQLPLGVVFDKVLK